FIVVVRIDWPCRILFGGQAYSAQNFCHALRPGRHVYLAGHPHGHYIADTDSIHGHLVFYGGAGFFLLVLPSAYAR
ncbi:hypothetical protein ACTHUR_11525, partial [Neisseria sp. P0021.S007]|uniref:hypothetical protein n=1 Tax=Neisseria sp. P0021.S007 TaxID=3436822 RepID=UPI003F80ED43